VGELSVTAGVAAGGPVPDGGRRVGALTAAVEEGDLAAALRLLEEDYGRAVRSLRTLWPEERRRALELVSERALESTSEAARLLYERRAPLLRALTEAGLPVPALWEAAAGFVLERSLDDLLASPSPDADGVRSLMERSARGGVRLDDTRVRIGARASLEEAADRFARDPVAEGRLRVLSDTLEAVRALPFEVGLRHVQDRWWEVRERLDAGVAAAPDAGWRETFMRLGTLLKFSVDGST
jgi:hypothetical protein